MVQLKSFKYIESESSAPNDEPLSTSSASSPSISTLAGGNLTSDSSQLDESNQQFKQPQEEGAEKGAIKTTVAQITSDEEATTLSSNEEYQLAEHDIFEEEEIGRESNSDSVTRIDVENMPPKPPPTTTTANTSVITGGRNFVKSSPSPASVSVAQKNGAAGAIRTPLILRQHIVRRGQTGSPVSPPLKIRQAVAAATTNLANDNTSQYSFGQRSNAATNHFEIRWRNINLSARKSKLPRFISDNPIYRILNKDSDLLEKMYNSPPMHHKMMIPSLPTTIDEELEMSPSKLDQQSPISDQSGSAGYRPILVNISGSVFSGQLTAILGPSGVGKTMLLNSLTGRNTLDGTGRVSLLGGASKRMSVVTVPQADVLPGKLTTLEDLRFTSSLKNPQPGFNHQRNIERIVRHLQMEKFLHTRIDKLSGGEARRLSIGRELLNSPDIMILDEPTSGLDANTCKKIITALRDIVEHSDNILDRPMSIIVTIHQPQQEVLNLFHRVYVMAVGGRAIYEGPPSNLLPSIVEQSSLSRVKPVDQLNENPAIVALEVASGEYGPNIVAELALHHESQIYEDSIFGAEDGTPYSTPHILRQSRKSPLSVSPRFELLHRARLNSALDSPTARHTPKMGGKRGSLDHMSNITNLSYASSWDADLPEPVSRLKVDKRLRRSIVMKSDFVVHTLTLMKRCWLLTTRDMFLMSIRIIGFLLVAGGMVQIFSHALDPNEHQCPNYESEVDDVITFMTITKDRLMGLQMTLKQSSSTHLFFFHLVLCITMVTSALTGLVFPLQMRMFVREYKNGWYSPASFITSQTLAELPVDIIGPTLALLITYPLCHQPESAYYWREAGYILVLIISSIICKSQAQIVGAFLMDSVENSVFISCVMVTPPALLSGIAVRISQMSLPLQILSYGSFLRYGFESLFLLRYGYGICPCDSETINGYPIRTTANAIPPHLDNLARGFLELSLPPSTNNSINNDGLVNKNNSMSMDGSTIEYGSIDDDHSNLFVKFLRLVTDASNMFVPNPNQLGSCEKYRSLYLMDMDIEDYILPKWISIMVLMFIISRFLTYFVIKTVIKMRR